MILEHLQMYTSMCEHDIDVYPVETGKLFCIAATNPTREDAYILAAEAEGFVTKVGITEAYRKVINSNLDTSVAEIYVFTKKGVELYYSARDLLEV